MFPLNRTLWRLSAPAAACALIAGTAPAQQARSSDAPVLPASAKPGECYARVHAPAVYETESKQVLTRDASSRIEIVPARYEWVEEKVLVEEASEILESVPPTYEWVEEVVTVKPASARLETIPAQYEWVDEQVMVRPARTEWKKGRGPIEKIDHASGEIMCLVEVPAEYRTVRKRVLKSPATTSKVEIPAVTKTIKKRVVKTPATTRTIKVDPKYKTVRIQKMVEPAREKKIEIPAEYETVTQRKLVANERAEWREVLCETNIRPGTVQALQRALKGAGHDPGPIDGIVGQQTLAAVSSYQAAKKLPQGGLTIATLDSLGVKP